MMTGGVQHYFATLTSETGKAWNAFWMRPRDPHTLAALRVLVGLIALYHIATYTPDLNRMFGRAGMVSAETISQLETNRLQQQQRPARFSYLHYFHSPVELWTVHVLGLLILAAFTAGWFSRISSVLALIVVLSYYHRGPVLTGEMEPVLAMLMLYLCLGPSGAAFSIDRCLAARKSPSTDGASQPSTSANIAIRLIQVHLSVIYFMLAMGKIGEPGGSLAWWQGEAVWWLAARPDSRLIDLTGLLAGHLYVVNAWSHAILLFELGFSLLIWKPLVRPLLLVLAVPMWISLALISGMTLYCATMLVANVAFVSPQFIRDLTVRYCGAPGQADAEGA